MVADGSLAFYAKVRVLAHDPELQEIHGEIAAVLGKGRHQDGGWSYTVFVYGDGLCYSCHERDLEPTGEHDVRETFYDGTSIRVRVDEQGRGHVVEE